MKSEKTIKFLEDTGKRIAGFFEVVNRGFERVSNVVAADPIGWLIASFCAGAILMAFAK